MASDAGFAVASTLGLDDAKDRNRYISAIKSKQKKDTSPRDSPVRLFEHKNGTWSVHGPDVIVAARFGAEDLRAVQSLVARDGSELETVWFGVRIARDLCGKVLEAGRKVEWHVEKREGEISLKGKGSPGSLSGLQELLGGEGGGEMAVSEGGVIAVKKGSKGRLGAAIWDGGRRTLSLGEFDDGENFADLEALLTSTRSMEALFCASDWSPYEIKKLEKVLESCGTARTDRNDFGRGSNEQAEFDLSRLAGSKFRVTRYLDMKLALSACTALIGFLGLMGDSDNDGKVKVVDITNNHMKLDAAALSALNVFPQGKDGGKRASLFGLLNKTKTAMGGRLLRRWLSQPLQDVSEIESRYDDLEAFFSNRQTTVSIRDDHLRMMPDLGLLCRRFTSNGSRGPSLEDLVRMYQCFARLPFLVSCFEECPRLSCSFASALKKHIQELHNFGALVETTIDLDQIDNGEFVISPKIDSNLSELRVSLDDLLAELSDEHNAVKDSLSITKDEQLKLERKDRGDRSYVFRLTRKNEKLIRGKSAYMVLETRKDGVKFQTRKLRKLSDQYLEISGDYDAKESELRAKTIEVAGTYVDVFADVANLLAKVDVLASFAMVASEAKEDYCRPQLKKAGEGLTLKDARHPMVEEMLDDREFIPNDMDLRRSLNDGDSLESGRGGGLLIVTGPNMAGKSTFIRMAGVITLMAHIGSFVPAASAEIPLTDRILARVGAGDNQHRAISTFMAEMLETSSILQRATPSSLVIIDELGRGTGTLDGFGLAYSIARHISLEIRSPCLFATHFHELTALAEESKAVRNVHVTARPDSENKKLTFLYKVRDGPCDQSFGIHVARMARFPESVVEAAKRKAEELEDFGPVATKRVRACNDEERKEIEAGLKIIAEFIKEKNKLPRDDEEMLWKESRRLFEEKVKPRNNKYVEHLIKQAMKVPSSQDPATILK